MVNPLSHDAFIVLSELESLGNQCTRELLTEAVHKRGIKGLDTLILGGRRYCIYHEHHADQLSMSNSNHVV